MLQQLYVENGSSIFEISNGSLVNVIYFVRKNLRSNRVFLICVAANV